MRALTIDIETRPIPGYAGFVITRDARIFSRRRHELAQWRDPGGYLRAKVGIVGLHVHRAVALAWIPNPHGASDVNHIDGDKGNNAISNLEWCSRSENIRHALDHGLHACPETPVIGFNESTHCGIWARSQAEVGYWGFQQPNVNKCLRGIRRSHKGFVWRYAA